jgi:hypothetical protein
MLDGALLHWYLLTAGSLIFLAYDLFANTPTTWVMKLAWFLVVLYTGPIGLFIFLLSCRQPLPGTHDQFIAAHWKQSVGSLMHCVAGDATGIILAAALTFRARFPTGIDMLIEYASGFLVGLFVFQALFMKLMTNPALPALGAGQLLPGDRLDSRAVTTRCDRNSGGSCRWRRWSAC